MSVSLVKTFGLAVLTVGLLAPTMWAGGNPTGPGFSAAHPRRAQVNHRVKNQRARINHNVKTGKLTAAQGAQLKANDRAIKNEEHADVKANGGALTKDQQKQINQEENANSKMIHDEAHPK